MKLMGIKLPHCLPYHTDIRLVGRVNRHSLLKCSAFLKRELDAKASRD